VCGANVKRLEVHHIKPMRKCATVAEANTLSNVLVCCSACHAKEEKKSIELYGKGKF
jgi:predicted HNH restriction endonuclease